MRVETLTRTFLASVLLLVCVIVSCLCMSDLPLPPSSTKALGVGLSEYASFAVTFELPDNAKDCYYEDLRKGLQTTVYFRVINGGHYDVDVLIEGPNNQILYREVKKQYDTFTFETYSDGAYKMCFSNEFSTFSHKLVYMDFTAGEEPPLPGVDDHATAMTQLELSTKNIHENLKSVIDYQTHHRLRETQGRMRGEDVNERVLWWSAFETLSILIIGFGQVLVLRNFFSEKRPSQLYRHQNNFYR